ncbi:ABC transporter permease [Schleiferiaceae bacterium]|nr:ABC transporter permease [Schleiferiaceae bacterium]
MSLTALVGLALGTAAMTVVLSAFAGLEDLVADQFEDANPPLKISPANGPNLVLSAEDSAYLNTEAARYPASIIEPVYEQRVLLAQGENQHITYILGVSDEYVREHRLNEHLLTQADPSLDLGENTLALGAGVAYHLGVSNANPPPIITVYLPKIDATTTALNLGDAVRAKNVFVTSIHTVQPDYDVNKAIAPRSWVQTFTGAKHPSYLEVYDDDNALRKSIEAYFGDRAIIADRLEQEATLFKVMRSERLVVLAILAFVVVLASFGIVSALTIIALEKKNDIYTLWSMGTSNAQLRAIFFKNGLLIVLAGWAVGLGIGTSIILIQKYIGVVSLGSGYIQEYYPVVLSWQHYLLTTTIVLSIGTSISLWSTGKVIQQINQT